jgi:hypothetical protein
MKIMSTTTKSTTLKKVVLEDIQTNEGIVERIHIAYQTWGKLNEKRDNVIWINHGLTADTNAQEWWPNMIGPGNVFDTNLYFIICPNIPGSCYGSSEPHEIILKSSENKTVQLGPREIAQIFHLMAKNLNSIKFMDFRSLNRRIYCIRMGNFGKRIYTKPVFGCHKLLCVALEQSIKRNTAYGPR